MIDAPRHWPKYRFMRDDVRKEFYYYFSVDNLNGKKRVEEKSVLDEIPLPMLEVVEMKMKGGNDSVGYRFRTKARKIVMIPSLMVAGTLRKNEKVADGYSVLPLNGLTAFRGKECTILVSSKISGFYRSLGQIP